MPVERSPGNLVNQAALQRQPLVERETADQIRVQYARRLTSVSVNVPKTSPVSGTLGSYL